VLRRKATNAGFVFGYTRGCSIVTHVTLHRMIHRALRMCTDIARYFKSLTGCGHVCQTFELCSPLQLHDNYIWPEKRTGHTHRDCTPSLLAWLACAKTPKFNHSFMQKHPRSTRSQAMTQICAYYGSVMSRCTEGGLRKVRAAASTNNFAHLNEIEGEGQNKPA
jgi:hypothetical protein